MRVWSTKSVAFSEWKALAQDRAGRSQPRTEIPFDIRYSPQISIHAPAAARLLAAAKTTDENRSFLARRAQDMMQVYLLNAKIELEAT